MPQIITPEPFLAENRPYFVDVNTNYLVDGQPLILTDILALNNEIYNILSTVPGERVFEPEFGSEIIPYLFDPTDAMTAFKIEIELTRALQRWMPRIIVLRESTRAIPLNTYNGYDVVISYRITGLNITVNNNFALLRP
jgi:phage baseplate assembly protein W